MRNAYKTELKQCLYSRDKGRTRRSDRAGKTRMALRLRQNRWKLMTKTILLLPKFVLSKLSHESEHSESEFYYPGELSHAELLHQSPTHSESKERNLALLANEEAHNFLRSQQANRRSRKQLFRINCPIANLWNKQTVSRRKFFPWKASKNSSWVKSKKTEEVNKVRYKCFLRVSEFLWEVV